MSCAPVAVFAYRRSDHLRRVIKGLAANPHAVSTQLVIFSDGPRDDTSAADVAAVRKLAHGVTGFKTVDVVERPHNIGLAASIVDGVTTMCDAHGRVVVLEDDVVPTPFFLAYVNEALVRYRDDPRVMSIGCYTFETAEALPETFFLDIPDCWGWAVWRRSWSAYDADGAKLLSQLITSGLIRDFDLDGAFPYSLMLQDQVAGHNASWAVRWYASQRLAGGLTLYPGTSVTDNIGQDGTGTHGVSTPLRARLATRPIVVEHIPVAGSYAARLAWANTLRRLQGSSADRAMYGLRQGLGRALRAGRRALPTLEKKSE